jgi:hypothetical protein
MTWTVTPSKLVGGNPIVKWDDVPLSQLDDETFAVAASAASALGETICLDATELKPGLAASAARADAIVLAVVREMERRGVDSLDDGGGDGPESRHGAKGTAAHPAG